MQKIDSVFSYKWPQGGLFLGLTPTERGIKGRERSKKKRWAGGREEEKEGRGILLLQLQGLEGGLPARSFLHTHPSRLFFILAVDS